MIGRLRGQLLSRQPPFLLLDVNGVCYEIEAPMSTFYELPQTGEQVTLHTHLMVREDAHVLYGFHAEQEKRLFRALLKVSGVGGKMALAILSTMNAPEFASCVHADDVTAMTRIPGVGRKTAQRLIIEMKDKLDDEHSMELPGGSSTVTQAAGDSPLNEAVSALVALGYKPAEAGRMVRSVD
ncbi:MAG: Holliday junction branch migration protein RuvA, partial [Chromatiales bacterium]